MFDYDLYAPEPGPRIAEPRVRITHPSDTFRLADEARYVSALADTDADLDDGDAVIAALIERGLPPLDTSRLALLVTQAKHGRSL